MASNLTNGVSHNLFVSSDPQTSERLNSKAEASEKESRCIKQNKNTDNASENQSQTPNGDLKIVWKNVLIFIVLHSICILGVYWLVTFQLTIRTVLFNYFYLMFAGFGITAGAHRLWAHRCYTAKLPLRIFLMLGQSAALQNDIHEWSRDHRVHHKFTDSNADPHNAKRGFFFSHMGWLMCKKHPDVFIKGKTVDMSDILRDPVVRFQMKYYIPLIILMNVLLPIYVTCYFCGETFWTAVVVSFTRYTLSLNGTWLVNSAAHIWGMKPYDKQIKPTENKFVAVVAFGEGWHNYHHVFPWDYKAAELGNYRWNFTTCFLDLMAKIGLATDLKTASEEIIRKRALRTGDNSWKMGKSSSLNWGNNENHHHHHHLADGEALWGWGDKDMNQEEYIEVKRFNRQKA